jgi:hypothetical protein
MLQFYQCNVPIQQKKLINFIITPQYNQKFCFLLIVRLINSRIIERSYLLKNPFIIWHGLY